jgi:tRNA pseudouridine38-40 synthase
MQAAAQVLLGEHDFSSFRASACQSPTPVKTLRQIDISVCGGDKAHAYWRFEFEANAFLHHMIRNIMGCLLQVGQGLQPVSWVQEVLQARNRDVAAPTFPPDGLYFLGPQYAPEWGLPTRTPAYDWLPCPMRP